MSVFCPATLYHGTDLKVWNMTEQERKTMAELCTGVADVCFDILSECGLGSVSVYSSIGLENKEKISDIWIPFCNQGLTRYSGRKNESKLYRYDGFYLTNNMIRAENYARNSFIFGEQGNVAYWLYTAASRIRNIRECITANQIDMIEKFEESLSRKREPVVIAFEQIPEEEILTETGNEIKDTHRLLSSSVISLKLKSGLKSEYVYKIIEVGN